MKPINQQECSCDADSELAETAELADVQISPCHPVMKLLPHARLTPLFEQPDSIVRAVVGGLSDSQLAQYRQECRNCSVLDDRTYIFR